MQVGSGGLGVKIFLALLLLYGTVSISVWAWNKIKPEAKKDEGR